MTRQLTQRLERLLAIGLLVLVLGIVWLCLIAPIVSAVESRSAARELTLRKLSKERSLLQQESAIEAAITTVASSARWKNFYEADRAETAELQLESSLRSIFTDLGTLDSMAAERPLAAGNTTRVSVRIAGSLTLDHLAEVLDRIQKQAQQIRVENLSIQAPLTQSDSANPALNIQALISALMISPSQRSGG